MERGQYVPRAILTDLEPVTLDVIRHSPTAVCSHLKTLFLAEPELVITGLGGIIPRVLNSLILSWMSYVKRLRVVTRFRDFNSHIPWAVGLAVAWGRFCWKS